MCGKDYPKVGNRTQANMLLPTYSHQLFNSQRMDEKPKVGIWEFHYESRDIRDKRIHPAAFPIALAKSVIANFTHRGELVLDPFVGTGTTLIASRDLDRNAVGFDIKKEYIDLCKKRVAQVALEGSSQQIPILDDARNTSNYLEPNSISLIFTSPSYANLLNRVRLNKSRRGDLCMNSHYLKVEQYSQDTRDLGTLPVERYTDAISSIFEALFKLLTSGGHCVINVTDMWWSGRKYGKRIPIHTHVLHALEKIEYEFRNTVIWDRNNIVNKIGIFGWPSNYITMGTTFEYLLHFWKPPV